MSGFTIYVYYADDYSPKTAMEFSNSVSQSDRGLAERHYYGGEDGFFLSFFLSCLLACFLSFFLSFLLTFFLLSSKRDVSLHLHKYYCD